MGAFTWVIDALLLVMIGVVTWAVASEGLWGATLIFINVLIAGLVTFSIFEPVAAGVARNVKRHELRLQNERREQNLMKRVSQLLNCKM